MSDAVHPVAGKPVHHGLFTQDTDDPRLIGGRCGDCGRYHFPKSELCPYCSAAAVEEVTLSGEGTLWAWTAVNAPPPGYHGEVPFGFGVVELSEGLRVITRLTEADPARLELGQRVRMTLVPLHDDEEGHPVVTYSFAPVPQ